jgi:hypothetical protein
MWDIARRTLAVLIALRGLTNFGKPFGGGSGFVVLGKLTHGFGSTVLAPLMGAVMLVYAWGLWRARPWARPLAVAYAVWATLNVVLFPLVEPLPPRVTPVLYALFAVAGIAGPWLAVWLLARSLRSA